VLSGTKKGGLGATPAFAAAPTIPFFQDNLLKIECVEFSRNFQIKIPGRFSPTRALLGNKQF
jgi:hypothetical protein